MWWWSTAIDHVNGAKPPDRTAVTWPGDGAEAVARLRELAARWRSTLTRLNAHRLTGPSAYPWRPDAGKTVAHTVLWVNVELTKNIVEIGQLRLLRAASRQLYVLASI